MREDQSLAQMANEVLMRQAKVRADRSGEPFEEAMEAVLNTEAGKQLRELRDGPHSEESVEQAQVSVARDRAYDASEEREFASSEGGYTTHIKVNPRKKYTTESSGQSSQQRDSHGEPHPARRWVVERTISWLVKRCSLRTRWSKKAENWLALIQLACAHVLLNLAVFR